MSAPRKEPLLLPYQKRWVRDEAQLKVCEKGRRIGISWAEAYWAVMHAGEGRGNIYYQSYNKEMTEGFIQDCSNWAKAIEQAASVVQEELLEDGEGSILQYRITFASGKEIRAMASSPRIFRSKGRPGDVAIIDEAAFVDDLEESLKSALAFLMWGGAVHLISTHNGEGSAFNSLVCDVREEKRAGSVHKVTFKDAIEEGLCRRIFKVAERKWSQEAEDEWEADVRASYGRRAEEELDCIPSAGSGTWLTWELIRAGEDRQAGDPTCYGGGVTWIGVDVARRIDLWVATVVEQVGDVLWVREMVVEQDIPFSQQEAIVGRLIAQYRPVRVAVDQIGMGEKFVEDLQTTHGELRVVGVQLTAPRKLDVATSLREAMEDRRLRIPSSEELRIDLHSVRREAGAGGTPKLVADRSDSDGHADRFWSIGLAVNAAADASGPVDGYSAGELPAASAFPVGEGADGYEVDAERGVVLSRTSVTLSRHYH